MSENTPEPNNCRDSPSSKLVRILFEKIAPTINEIADLNGKYILIEESDTIGKVVATEGNNVRYKPIFRYIPRENSRPNIEYFAEDSVELSSGIMYVSNDYLFINLNPPVGDLHRSYKVYTTLPSKFSISESASFITSQGTFCAGDETLDDILNKALRRHHKTESPEDLKKLTSWVHSLRPYQEIDFGNRIFLERSISIGGVWRQYGAVCRHFAALEFAILTLQNRDARLVATDDHAFLEVPFGDNGKASYVVDPTWDICCLKENLHSELRRAGFSTEYHKDYHLMNLVPLWD